jgi:predicted DNA binding protein/ActR/RegA family two-component response regulator
MVSNPDSTVSSQPRLTDVAVLLVDDDEQWARATARLLESAEPAFEVDLAHSLSAGRQRFEATDPDCVICDYQLGDGTGLSLLETVREADTDRPFVLVTGRGDETVASDAIGRGVTDYILKRQDDTESTLLANRVRNAVLSVRARRQLDRERRGKAATLDILTSTTNVADLSEEFCRLLVEDHGYAGVWIGEIEDGPDSGVVPRAVEGCEAYLDAVATSGVVSTGAADPAVMAVRDDEPIVSHTDTDRVDGSITERYTDTTTDWQRLAQTHGFVTAVGIPLEHDGIREGVLCVYCSTDSPPLDEQRWTLLEEYAEIVGYAHQTAGVKRSLVSDQSIHVDIEIGDPAAPLADLTAQFDERVSVEVVSTIDQTDSTSLYLTHCSGVDRETLRTAIESCEALELQSLTATDDGIRSDIRTTVRTPEDILASQGAQIQGTVSAAGSVTVSVSVVDHSVVSSLTTALRTEYDDVTVTTVWNHDDQPSTETDDPLASLTEKQRNVLSHAYFDGYFEQPRGASATELSEKFDISRVTMTQHLRTAQRKVFDQLFDQ